MLSRAEVRVRGEQALRSIVMAVLAMMLWQSLHQRSSSGRQTVNARGIGGALTKWSALPAAPVNLHVQLDSMPPRIERAWLGALAGAGSSVSWSGDLSPVMIDVQPIASPTGGTNVRVAAPNGSSVVMSDDVGLIDTLRAQNAGAGLNLNSVPEHLAVRVNASRPSKGVNSFGSLASTTRLDSVEVNRVLVIGDAGWESKFVIAALEEEGWKVDAFIRVAPGVDVTQGSTASIDTPRYSAVVALDGAAAPYATRILEFARMGGGVVLAPEAAALDAMAPLRAGTQGRASSDARAIQTGGSVSLATLPLAPISSLRSDAIALEKRAGAVAIAARRFGAGRVLQLGYEDTWRWRMGGGDGAVMNHRIWWTGLVSSVAYSTRIPITAVTAPADEAPMIGLVGALGRSTSAAAIANFPRTPSTWAGWLLLLLTIGLLGEVASRRLRGAS